MEPNQSKFSQPASPGKGSGWLRSLSCDSLPSLICPLCASSDVGLIAGKVAFTATINREKFCKDSAITLTACVCANSHIFFMRECDVIPVGNLKAA